MQGVDKKRGGVSTGRRLNVLSTDAGEQERTPSSAFHPFTKDETGSVLISGQSALTF
jgi:hypothetical protein